MKRYRKTPWGRKVSDFSDEYGITIKEIAALSGVNYNTLLQVRIGRTPGEQIIEKVEAFMKEYKSRTDRPDNTALNPF